MTRDEIKQHNQKVIDLITGWLEERRLRRWHFGYRLPIVRMGYKQLAARLNTDKIRTSRDNSWTARSLYRMMQRRSVRLIDLQN